MKTLSSSDLLKFSVEIVASFPEGTDFDEKKLRTPFQQYRHIQILSLMKAYGITGSFQDFISGSFISIGTENQYDEALREIRKTLKMYPKEVVTKRKLSQIFQLSFGFLVAIYRIQRFWKNYIIADPALLYPQIVCKNLNNGIMENSRELENVLCLLIDPGKTKMPLSELIDKHGYIEMSPDESNNL